MEKLIFIAQAAAEAAPETAQNPGGSNFIWILLLMFAAMYFLMIAPQRKRQKAHQKMLSELKTGDDVVTIGGAMGTITNVKEKTFVIRLGDNNKVEFLKAAIQDKVAKDDASATSVESK